MTLPAPIALRVPALGLAALLLLTASGCEKRLDPAEYGQVIYELPKIEGADQPFPLPKLDEQFE